MYISEGSSSTGAVRTSVAGQGNAWLVLLRSATGVMEWEVIVRRCKVAWFHLTV